MIRVISRFALALLISGFGAASGVADDAPVAKKLAALAESSAKLDALEQSVDDISLTGALALLGPGYPDWEFSRGSAFDSTDTGASDDLGALSANHEYGMGKLRGAIFRNTYVSENQRASALQIVDDVKALILIGYDVEALVDKGDMETAGDIYRDRLLRQSDDLNTRIEQLTRDIEQTIKFAAL